MATITTLPFDNSYVLDRLPLSHEQKMALIKQLSTDKTKILDQCQSGTTDSDQTDVACALEETPLLPAEIVSHPA